MLLHFSCSIIVIIGPILRIAITPHQMIPAPLPSIRLPLLLSIIPLPITLKPLTLILIIILHIPITTYITTPTIKIRLRRKSFLLLLVLVLLFGHYGLDSVLVNVRVLDVGVGAGLEYVQGDLLVVLELVDLLAGLVVLMIGRFLVVLMVLVVILLLLLLGFLLTDALNYIPIAVDAIINQTPIVLLAPIIDPDSHKQPLRHQLLFT